VGGRDLTPENAASIKTGNLTATLSGKGHLKPQRARIHKLHVLETCDECDSLAVHSARGFCSVEVDREPNHEWNSCLSTHFEQ
jgi:hypothetical protein